MVTCAVEADIMMPANQLVQTILWSCLARAQHLHPVRICHFLFEGTHVHFIMIVDDPNDIPDFMERFKTESAHAINRLLGRKKRTIWCEGFDNPALLTPTDVIDKISYVYLNPIKDGLVQALDEYPGISSWRMFKHNRHQRSCPHLRRTHIVKLPSRSIGEKLAVKLTHDYTAKSRSKHTFTIHPEAWMECFKIQTEDEKNVWRDRLAKKIEDDACRTREQRAKENRGYIGRNRLMSEALGKSFEPKRRGKRMRCICCNIALRKIYLARTRALIAEGRAVFLQWLDGEWHIPYPLGLFPPAYPKRGELLGLTAL